MAGKTDYLTLADLNYATGGLVMPALPTGVWLGLMTTAPTSDTGSLATNGGAEVAVGTYARVQVAGQLTTNAVTTSSAVLNFAATVPSWIVAGMYVRDITTPANIPANITVLSTTTTSVTVSSSLTSVGSGDHIQFCAFAQAVASSGTEPVTTPASIGNTNTVIQFPLVGATTAWGTVNSWFLADAASGNTNILWWDYMGNFKWLPFTGTLASPSIFTVPAHGFSNGDTVFVTQKFGGVLPSAGSFSGALTVAGITTDTFNVGVNAASASGAGSVRKVVPQPIVINNTVSFAAGALVLSEA